MEGLSKKEKELMDVDSSVVIGGGGGGEGMGVGRGGYRWDKWY